MSPMRFALLTDVHFGPPASFDGKLRKLSHLAPELTRTVARELALEHQPQVLVNLGDVIEDASKTQDRVAYGAFLAAARTAGAPLLHVAGNHDQVHLDDADLAELWGQPGPLHYSRDLGGVHFVVLCTRYQPHVEVTLPQAQLAWLAADLAATRLPTIVLVHHPLAEMDLRGNRWFARDPALCLVANRAEAREVIARSGRVVAVLNGHAHWGHVGFHDRIPYVTLQSLTENLDEDAPGRAARAYTVAEVEESRFWLRAFGEEPMRLEVSR